MKIINTKFGNVTLDDEDYENLIKLHYDKLTLWGNKIYIIFKDSKQLLTNFVIINMLRNPAYKGSGKKIAYKDNNTFNLTRQNILIKSIKHIAEENASKYYGVTKSPTGKFEAIVRINKLKLRIGVYNDEVVAAIAYNKALDVLELQTGTKNIIDMDKEKYDEIYKYVAINTQLRSCKQGGNRKLKDTTSKYTGVYWDKSREKWESRIYYNTKRIYISRFINELEAAQAYNEVVILLYGIQGRLNPIPKPMHPIVDLNKIIKQLEKRNIIIKYCEKDGINNVLEGR